jgi:hypothetical protein
VTPTLRPAGLTVGCIPRRGWPWRSFHSDVAGIRRTPGERDEPHGRPTAGQYALMPTVVVRDEGQPISISFDDLLKYHGSPETNGMSPRSSAWWSGATGRC